MKTGCATPIDDRIDPQTFTLNQRVTRIIPEWYKDVRIEKIGSMPVHSEEVWTAYLAAEIYNDADAALMCIAHNRGRPARLLERQMYELYVKARFYADNPDIARLEYLAMPFRDVRLEDQMVRDATSPRYQSILAAVNIISSKFPEVVTYVRDHKQEISLRTMVGAENDADADQEYAIRYRRLSQTVHGAAPGMHYVFDYRNDREMGIGFDGRLPDPTFAVHSMTSILIAFVDVINRVHRLGRDALIRGVEQESDSIAKRLWPPIAAAMENRLANENAEAE